MAQVLGQFVGLKEANAALKKLPEFAKVRAQTVQDVTAFRVAAIAKTKVRRSALDKLLHLQDAITWASRPRSVSSVVGVPSGQGSPFYWKFLEYGTVKMGARPMFRPAADAVRNQHQSDLMRVLEDAANQVERAQGAIGGRFL